ncbi:Lrp/AsnC ligand binding domain-containing protein, partial [Streptomyces sp. NPDC059616]|uniref:Lrp/AsnC ligand binding domain-containing protein n=1 Tax=Streptomyces sp. NPDC059616 TaxID=3346886 RepID=UPI003693B452
IEIYGSRNPAPVAIRGGLAGYPETASAARVTGVADAIVQVFAADMRHFEQVLERIAGEPYVERTKSVLVLSPLLRRYAAGPPDGPDPEPSEAAAPR